MRRARATAGDGSAATSRGRGDPRPAAPSSLRLGQREVERGALVHFALGPHAAAMPLHDPFHDRQADARALELLGLMEPLKYAEQLVGVARIEARAVVFHIIHVLIRSEERRVGKECRSRWS